MNSNLDIVIWDVQHGNAIYMNTPNGKHVMFDIGTGSHTNKTEFSPLSHLKYKWQVDHLDYLVISHPHADHISDIQNMLKLGLQPKVLHRPRNIDSELIRSSHQDKYSGSVESYLKWECTYRNPVPSELDPSNPSNYGGVQMNFFSQDKSGTKNLNNYSIVSVIKYAAEKIVIPGDIETAGWKTLLEKIDFKQAIMGTTIFVASHHGREAGFHSDVFKYFKPDIVIVSDKPSTDTSVTDRYTYHAKGTWVKRKSAGFIERKVLTTRNDGCIHITVGDIEKLITIN